MPQVFIKAELGRHGEQTLDLRVNVADGLCLSRCAVLIAAEDLAELVEDGILIQIAVKNQICNFLIHFVSPPDFFGFS